MGYYGLKLEWYVSYLHSMSFLFVPSPVVKHPCFCFSYTRICNQRKCVISFNEGNVELCRRGPIPLVKPLGEYSDIFILQVVELACPAL